MSGVPLTTIAAHLDALLRIRETPDYSSALNGVQVEHRGPVKKIAAAVDTSARTIRGAVDAGANMMLVHHGLFWGGLQPLTGQHYSRVRLLLDHDVATIPGGALPDVPVTTASAREIEWLVTHGGDVEPLLLAEIAKARGGVVGLGDIGNKSEVDNPILLNAWDSYPWPTAT